MSKRSDALKTVEEYRKAFECYIGKQMTLKFGKFCFPIIISDIGLAKLGDLENKPDTRLGTDGGKNYKPPVMYITTDVGTLYFILEDIHVSAIFNGLHIQTDATTVKIRIADGSTTNRQQ